VKTPSHSNNSSTRLADADIGASVYWTPKRIPAAITPPAPQTARVASTGDTGLDRGNFGL